MKITRIDSYRDPRFSDAVLLQHGAFLLEGEPYEVEIISDCEAIVRGKDQGVFRALIEEFRFFTPHITKFYNEERALIVEFPPVNRICVPLSQIQPSQFYADRDKVDAVSSFICNKEDIVIQVMKHGPKYIALDGHTRLYLAASKGWESVYAVEEEMAYSDSSYFVEEAKNRGIMSPCDLELLDHEEYEEKWNRFCDAYFREKT